MVWTKEVIKEDNIVKKKRHKHKVPQKEKKQIEKEVGRKKMEI